MEGGTALMGDLGEAQERRLTGARIRVEEGAYETRLGRLARLLPELLPAAGEDHGAEVGALAVVAGVDEALQGIQRGEEKEAVTQPDLGAAAGAVRGLNQPQH